MWRGVLLVLLLAVVGAAIGWTAAPYLTVLYSPHRAAVLEPYVVPRQPGGLSLSMAMVHDVLHERYLRPGTEYYAEKSRRLLASLPSESNEIQGDRMTVLAGLNDLAIAQFQTGQTAESLATLDRKQALQSELDEQWQRDKLKRPGSDAAKSWALGNPERIELYRTYANRGTILILDALGAGLSDNESAQEELARGTEIIREAIAMNADSHFGREPWQLVILEFLQAVCARPELLLEFDMVGNRLDASAAPDGRPHVDGWIDRWQSLALDDQQFAMLLAPNPDESSRKLRREVRDKWIAKVGAERGWTSAVRTSHEHPAPFDEPTLAIVGMWMIGGGPNPHFALALGGVMERAGRFKLAWQAYRRAELMSLNVWPDQSIQQGFVEHCQRKRAELAAIMAAHDPETSAAAIQARLESDYQQELAQGLSTQELYREFEEDRIAAGHAPEFDDFHEAFAEKYGDISSASGEVDQIGMSSLEFRPRDRLPATLFCAGLSVLPAWLLLRRSKAKG